MKKPRLQGYYICSIPCCTEFVSLIPLKHQKCPTCGKMVERLSYLNSTDIDNYKQRRIYDAVGAYYDGFC